MYNIYDLYFFGTLHLPDSVSPTTLKLSAFSPLLYQEKALKWFTAALRFGKYTTRFDSNYK